MAEILEKISLVFWEILRHQKDILKLTDLYDLTNFKKFVKSWHDIIEQTWQVH